MILTMNSSTQMYIMTLPSLIMRLTDFGSKINPIVKAMQRAFISMNLPDIWTSA